MKPLILAVLLTAASAGVAAAQCTKPEGCSTKTEAELDAYYNRVLRNGGWQRAIALQRRRDHQDAMDCRYLGRCR